MTRCALAQTALANLTNYPVPGTVLLFQNNIGNLRKVVMKCKWTFYNSDLEQFFRKSSNKEMMEKYIDVYYLKLNLQTSQITWGCNAILQWYWQFEHVERK